MAVYNSERYIASSIESILNQTYRNIEFIIVNDGSSDNSIAIIYKYVNREKRVICINQVNMGLTKALNVGIEVATGDYVARMDADDISLLNRLENFSIFIENNGQIELYSTPSYVIDENSNVKRVIPNYFRRNGFNQKSLNYYNSLIHGTLIVKTSIIKKFKYNENYKYSQDFELYHRLMRNGYQISYDQYNITYKLRMHSSSISNTKKIEQMEMYKGVFIENGLNFHEATLFKRVLFRILDFIWFIRKNIIEIYR